MRMHASQLQFVATAETESGMAMALPLLLLLLLLTLAGVEAAASQAWSYVVTVDATTGAATATGRATLEPHSGSPSRVLNSCVGSLPRSGGTIFLTAGTYLLDETVVIDRSSVEIRGESMGGDLFFASDGCAYSCQPANGHPPVLMVACHVLRRLQWLHEQDIHGGGRRRF
jgi:hypothetical protein